MFSDKEEAEKYFFSEIHPRIVWLNIWLNEIKFLRGLGDAGEVVLRRDIEFFRNEYEKVLENILRVCGDLRSFLFLYLDNFKKAVNRNGGFSEEEIEQQIKDGWKVRNNLKLIEQHLLNWRKNNNNYYSERSKTVSFELENGNSVEMPEDSLRGRYFYINPTKVPVEFPLNLTKLEEFVEFFNNIQSTHVKFFSPDLVLSSENLPHGDIEGRFKRLSYGLE